MKPKEKLELYLALQELADNKLSKTFDHEISNRVIDSSSMWAGLCTPIFANITDKIEAA